MPSWEQDPDVASAVAYVALCGFVIYQASLLGWRGFSEKYIKPYKTFNSKEKLAWDAKGPSTVHAVALSASAIYMFLCTDLFHETKVKSLVIR